MKKSLFAFTRAVSLATTILIISICNTNAQSSHEEHSVVFEIDQLNESERNSIVADLSEQTEMEVSFMCLPAGILVFSCPEDKVEELSAIIDEKVGSRSFLHTDQDVAFAEQQCAHSRNNR